MASTLVAMAFNRGMASTIALNSMCLLAVREHRVIVGTLPCTHLLLRDVHQIATEPEKSLSTSCAHECVC